MRRIGTLVVAGALAVAVVVIGLPVLMFMSVLGGSTDPAGTTCGDDLGVVRLASATSQEDLTEQQLANVATIIRVGREMNVPTQAIVIALAVAHQESGFLNYANDGLGGDLAFEQTGIAASMELLHEAVGTDHGSLGVFQQQWPWWGTMNELMDPETSSRKFYTALLLNVGWEQLTVTQAGQAVQRSAYPDAYGDDEPLARQLLQDPRLGEVAAIGTSSSAVCAAGAVQPGTVAYPLPSGANYVDDRSYGQHGERWSQRHTGTDLATECGTPVLAATAGVVVVRTDQPWAGNWLVQVTTGVERLTTWYAHMQTLTVEDGEHVTAGQPLGEVGALGNATGCHLHFEVHPNGGSIYEDDIDPTAWLAANVGKNLSGGLVVPASTNSSKISFLTGNVPFDLSTPRAREQLLHLLKQDPDVLLIQEVTNRDVTDLVADAPGAWGVWQPLGRRGGSAIVWNANRLALDKRGAELGFSGPDYDRWMTWAILRSSGGAFSVVGLHMPTNATVDPTMRRHYLTMTRNYQRLVAELQEAGYPPIVGGDWNHPLDRTREPWSPVPMLDRVGLTTNWLAGRPCEGTSARGGRIDGFAYDAGLVDVVEQGCLSRRHSDHRPVWMVAEIRS